MRIKLREPTKREREKRSKKVSCKCNDSSCRHSLYELLIVEIEISSSREKGI